MRDVFGDGRVPTGHRDGNCFRLSRCLMLSRVALHVFAVFRLLCQFV